MLDSLDGLRLDAIIGSDDQDDDISRSCTTRTHRCKGRVPGRIQKCNFSLVDVDRVRTDMLGDTAGLAGRDLGVAYVIEQSGLAMIDVSHDGNDWCPYDLITGWRLICQQVCIDIRAADRLGDMTQLFHHQDRSVLIDDLVNRHHRAHVEQDLDDFIALHCHLLRKLRHGNAFGNLDLADNRCGWPFETMLPIRADIDRTAASRSLASAPATLVARNV